MDPNKPTLLIVPGRYTVVHLEKGEVYGIHPCKTYEDALSRAGAYEIAHQAEIRDYVAES